MRTTRHFPIVGRTPWLPTGFPWVLLAAATFAWPARGTEPDPGADPSAAGREVSEASESVAGIDFFERRIRPLLVDHCYECHAGDEWAGGLRVDSREDLLEGGDSGPAVRPGDPDGSRLIEAVSYRNLDLQMPPAGRLSDQQVADLRHWVEAGAADPRRRDSDRPANPPTGMSIEAGRQFWSFRPRASVSPPRPADPGWVRTPIDAFILDRLDGAGLAAAPPADRRTLIRRVTFDLTGLPPTPEETEAFLADESPGAWERVIDRLLASPRYGERWGRHWLDVARYADSNGLDENLAYGNAWRYRDYVIDSFNRDRPFDRFLIEQLAGDLIPDADRDSRTATGFLSLGAKVLAEPDHEKLVMDIIDEQLDTTGKAFLGMTLGCVRCHDHKFDPILQRDYYALAAIFKSSRTLADSKTGAIHHWYEHAFGDEAELARIEQVDAAIGEKKAAANRFKSQAMSAIRSEAVSRAAVYLAAAAEISPAASLRDIEGVAEPLGLHPRILHHCRLHLEYHREQPLWARWHRLVGDGAGFADIESHFAALFAEPSGEAAEGDAGEQDAAEGDAVGPGDDVAELRALAQTALQDASGFLTVPAKPAFAFDEATLAEYYRLLDEARVAESEAPDAPAAMGVGEAETLVRLPLHIRGSHRNLGDPVPRGFPRVMLSPGQEVALPDDRSGRLEFARWLADPDHPLTARVYVNRVWRWHFGRGLVASTENFGVLGDRPSHPELLDWLAEEFVRSGWSTKSLQRLILSSAVYQMASYHPQTEQAATIDPENALRWRFDVRRLEAEPIRDAILEVSGMLDRTVGGKTVPLRNRQFVFDHTSIDHTDYDSRRRAVYLPVIRNHLYTFFEQFDFPDPTMPSGDRAVTVIAPQTLLLMNDDFVMEAAASLADRSRVAAGEGMAGRVEWIYRRAVNRPPGGDEVRRAERFVTEVSGADSRELAWQMFCQALLSSNEFVFVR